MDHLAKMLMVVAMLFATTMSFAEDAPSNDQLFEMFKQSQAKMAELEARTVKSRGRSCLRKS